MTTKSVHATRQYVDERIKNSGAGHTHENKPVIDGIEEYRGSLYYKGKIIGADIVDGDLPDNWKEIIQGIIDSKLDEGEFDESRFPDVLPDTPQITAESLFNTIKLTWTYENKVYYTYELHGDTQRNFITSGSTLIYEGKSSSFLHKVQPGETWYYKMLARNTHGNATFFSNEVSATSLKIEDAENYFGEASIGSALIGSLNADVINSGTITGQFIDAKNLQVTDGNGDKTLEVTDMGDVLINARELRISGSMATSEETVDAKIQMYDGTIKTHIQAEFIEANNRFGVIESEIEQTKDSIAMKVNNTDVYMKDEVYSIEQTESLIETKATSISMGVAQTTVEGAVDEFNNIVEGLENRVTTAEARITINEDGIQQTVSRDEYNGESIVSMINQTADEIQIQADKISLKGVITAEDLAGEGTTVINGSNITTGKIDARMVTVATPNRNILPDGVATMEYGVNEYFVSEVKDQNNVRSRRFEMWTQEPAYETYSYITTDTIKLNKGVTYILSMYMLSNINTTMRGGEMNNGLTIGFGNFALDEPLNNLELMHFEPSSELAHDWKRYHVVFTPERDYDERLCFAFVGGYHRQDSVLMDDMMLEIAESGQNTPSDFDASENSKLHITDNTGQGVIVSPRVMEMITTELEMRNEKGDLTGYIKDGTMGVVTKQKSKILTMGESNYQITSYDPWGFPKYTETYYVEGLRIGNTIHGDSVYDLVDFSTKPYVMDDNYDWYEEGQRLVERYMLTRGYTIGANVNLNDYTTPGVYMQNSNANATSGSNYPTASAGVLEVLQTAGVIQRYTAYHSGVTFVRGWYGYPAGTETWTGWKRVIDSDFSPRSGSWYYGFPKVNGDGVMEIGRYIDFHESNTTTADYNLRLSSDSNRLRIWGDGVQFSNGGRIWDSASDIFLGKSTMPGTTNSQWLGWSDKRWLGLYAQNGTIQTSDERYKSEITDVDDEIFHSMIKGVDVQTYVLNDERVDTKSATPLTLEEADQERKHLGIIAQDMAKYEGSEFILNHDEEQGYTVNNYNFTSAVMSALKHEIVLREQADKRIIELEERLEKLEALLLN